MKLIQNSSLGETIHPQMTIAARIVMPVTVIIIGLARTNELRFAAAGLFFGTVFVLLKCARAHRLAQFLAGLAGVALLVCAYVFRGM